jgi:hypothetical protein
MILRLLLDMHDDTHCHGFVLRYFIRRLVTNVPFVDVAGLEIEFRSKSVRG